MSFALIVRPEAEDDLSEAYNWYEAQRFGLGEEFLLRVESAFESLRHDPHMYTCIYKEMRRKLIRRFPFSIFYLVNKNTISVLAVMHAKRHPKSWKKRV